MQGLSDLDTAHAKRLGQGIFGGDLSARRPCAIHNSVPELRENLILYANALHSG